MILKPDVFAAFEDGKARVLAMLQALEDDDKLEFRHKAGTGTRWQRTSDRYDTEDGWLNSQSMSCAVEYSIVDGNRRSKIKLKYNVWDPDAAYDSNRIKRCLVSPSKDYRGHAKLKLEQDFNARGTKFGLGGRIFVENTDKVTFGCMADLKEYFKQIARLEGYDGPRRLVATSSYSESVFDNIEFKIGPGELPLEGSLGARYDSGGQPFKVEFSIKAKEPDDGWSRRDQHSLSRLFQTMIHHELHVDFATIDNSTFPPVARQSL